MTVITSYSIHYTKLYESVCSDGGTSDWVGPLNFSTLPEGVNCESSIP